MADNSVKSGEGKFTNKRKVEIFTRSWIPSTPKGVIFILHGIGDHSGRYLEFAESLSKNGYATYAMDFEAHGKSTAVHQEYFDRFSHLVEDFESFFNEVKEKHPSLPKFIFGHSAGGSVAIHAFYHHPKDVFKGIVLSSPSVGLPHEISKLTFHASKAISGLTPKKGVKEINLDTLNADPAEIKKYKEDPLVWHKKIKARPAVELLLASDKNLDQAKTFNVSYLMLTGAQDKMLDRSQVEAFHKETSSTDKKRIDYETQMHELVTGPERKKVIDDIMKWLDERLTNTPTFDDSKVTEKK